MKKLFPVLGVVALALGIVVLAVPSAKAAPAGTLTSAGVAPLTVDIGQIVTVPDLTVTDAGGEITLANDIRIQIPVGVNAIWDTTVLAPTMTPTGATLAVAAAVTYPDSKTLLIDVTASATAGDSLAISGLKVIGVTGATAGAALTWSVDGGLTYGASADPNASIVVANGAEDTLTAVTAVSASAVVSTQTNYVINFTIPATGVLPADGKITVTFPAGFTVASDAASGASGIDGGFAVGVVGQVATITRNGAGTNATAGAKSITINKITNHATANSTYTVAVATTTTADAALANANSAAFLVNPAAITTLTCQSPNQAGAVYLTWTVPAGVTAGYVIRYSSGDITTQGLFNAATDYVNTFVSGTPGQSSGSNLLVGLAPNAVYFFNVEAKGAGTSQAAISNTGVVCRIGSGGSSGLTTLPAANPTSSVSSPADNSTVPAEATVTIRGTSADTSASSIEKVEVSTDGGTIWFEATPTASNSNYGFDWTYTWTNPAEGPHVIKTRATDRSGAVETPGAGITVTVGQKSAIVIVSEGQAPSTTPVVGATVDQIKVQIRTIQEQLIVLIQQLIQQLLVELQGSH
jgi:hypothetical protein